jgi:hypothetical protein
MDLTCFSAPRLTPLRNATVDNFLSAAFSSLRLVFGVVSFLRSVQRKVIHRRDVFTLVVFTGRNLTSETRPKFLATRFWRVQGADRGTKAVSGAFMGK